MQQFWKLVACSALAGWVVADVGDADIDSVKAPCDGEIDYKMSGQSDHYSPNIDKLEHWIDCLIIEYKESLGQKLDPKDERNLQRNNMGLLDRYGCWCYFENDHGLGSGDPIDTIDTMCQVLHKGYECILLDNLNDDSGNVCDPWTVEYNSAFGSGSTPFGLDMGNLAKECDLQNPSPCEAATCKVEGNFVLSYFKYAVVGGLIEITNRHELGFDTSVCLVPRSGASGTSHTDEQQSCCGTYPIRFPYWAEDHRVCCQATSLPTNSITYNPDNGVCCPDTGTTAGSVMSCGQ